jgi:hypothetical protein
MSAVAVGVGAVAAIGAGYAASQSAKAGARRAAGSQNVANEENYQRYLDSRGAGGNVFMPTYMRSSNGNPFEQQFAQDMITGYEDNGFGNPGAMNGQYQAIQSKYAPMSALATRSASGLFDGSMTQSRLDNFAPVANARVNYTREAAMDSLNKTLGEINATQVGRGFSGDSLGNRMMKFNANASANNAVAGARLQNLEEARGIKDQGLMMPIQYAGLPGSLAQSDLAMANLSRNAYFDAMTRAEQPFQFFKIGVGAPPQVGALPTYQGPSTAQIVAQGVAQGAGMYSQASAYNNANNQWQSYLDSMRPSSPTPGPTDVAPGSVYSPLTDTAYQRGHVPLYAQMPQWPN